MEEEKKQFALSWNKLWIPFTFLIVIWILKWTELRFDMDFSSWGVYPKNVRGLKGILAAPMIHGDLSHLLHNSLPFVALSLAIIYFYGAISNSVFLVSYLTTGILVWIFGRESFHIGASGLVYALASFVFFSGLIRQHAQLIAISLLVVFLYGGMVWGLFPIEPRISWESHLSGAVVGLFLAVWFRNIGPQRKRYSWEDEEEENLQLAEQNPIQYTYVYKPKVNDEEDQQD